MVSMPGIVKDRVGIGWRGELAAGIFSNLEQLDLLEIIADDHFRSSARELRPLRTLATQVPITLHGVSMGLASSEAVAAFRMENMARVVDALRPESWSEHLAFVRAGGIEIGHLAAPPRTEANSAATVANIERATRIVGAEPLLENIATLIAPPASTLDEAEWTSAIIGNSGAGLLLDLHNLYANAVNFNIDPVDLLMRMPLTRVRAVHISGGEWIAEPGDATPPRMRLLDDHIHDVPPIVFTLLELLAREVLQPLDVIVERDGAYPTFERLLNQLSQARNALARGRAQSMMLREAA